MFALTEDQRVLASTARAFADEHLAPQALDWDRRGHFPVDVLRKAGEIGLGGLVVAEEHGGSGLSRVDAAVIVEQLATGCPSIAAYVSIHNMVAWMVDSFGDATQRARWLPGICAMTDLTSYCLTEADAGSDATAISTRAVRDGEHYVLHGTKQFISGAGTSSYYLVMARTGAPGALGLPALLVEAGRPGLSFGPLEEKMGWHAQPTRAVHFDAVRVPVGNRIGDEGMGFLIAMLGLDGGRLNIAACSLGGAQFTLERSTSYLTERHAFGGPLADLQALRFTLADMHTDLTAARALLWQAAAALDRNEPTAPQLCAMAKRFATDAGFEVANRALQLHGGYGYLTGFGIEKVVRDLRVHQILEGTNEIMRVIVANGLIARPEPPGAGTRATREKKGPSPR